MGQQPLCGATGGAALRRGKIADTWGRKRAFLTGLTIFVAGSVLAGFPTSGATWISARAVQAIGAAFIMPSTLSTGKPYSAANTAQQPLVCGAR
ncbi:MFS transporter [uncultured Corynebacterium sp.]|uniref:MFS transporter n=1 Tax=uncultured Corynebacterium sp. TaxID=159447 RepID=UPI0025D7A303|nr:MFS transporter [uncultured Corynebacterium sp.]